MKKDKKWQATLLSPSEMGKFLTTSSGWENAVLSPISATFQVNKIEDMRAYINFPLAPHRKTVYDFLFLTAGTTIRSKGIDTYNLSENMFFFLPAYQILSHEYMSQDVKGYYCHFDEDIFGKSFIQQDLIKQFTFLQYSGNPIVKVPATETPQILHLLQRLEVEYKTGVRENIDIICTYLLALFFELKRHLIPEDKKTFDASALLTQRYKDALHQYIYDYQKIAEFAKLLHVTPNHLNKCVQATTGKSSHDLLTDVILLESKALLKQSDLSISEIAYKIGKKDHSDFSRFFKTHVGLTPKEYRNEP